MPVESIGCGVHNVAASGPVQAPYVVPRATCGGGVKSRAPTERGGRKDSDRITVTGYKYDDLGYEFALTSQNRVAQTQKYQLPLHLQAGKNVQKITMLKLCSQYLASVHLPLTFPSLSIF